LAIGQRAQVFAAKQYDNYEIARRILTFYKQLCGIKTYTKEVSEV
jgi:hypothetical protein